MLQAFCCLLIFFFKLKLFEEILLHRSDYIAYFCLSILKGINDFSLSVKAATLIFISGRGSAISSAKQGKSGSIYNLVKS